MRKIKTAIIGCGAISGIYLDNLCDFFTVTEVVGCADLIEERAREKAEKYGIKYMTNEEIYADSEIEIVVNLTYPLSHYEVTKAALLSGKHVYCEKMMAVTFEEGEELVKIAREKNLNYTMAPDTFLGGGLQTARWIIDSGMIGKPIMVSGVCQRNYRLIGTNKDAGMVHKAGGGIPFDMGGYYIHAMVNMLGGIEKVSGFAKILNKERKYLNPKNEAYKEDYTEECINTISASMQFESGVLGSLVITSESCSGHLQKIEVVGEDGALCIHDPNDFQGPITVYKAFNNEALTIPYTHAFCENTRGIGVADMAYAINNKRKARADASLGLHAFEIIHSVWKSTETGETYTVKNKVDRPKAVATCSITGQCAEYVLDD